MEPFHVEPAKAPNEGEPRTRAMLNDILADGLNGSVSAISFLGSGSLPSVFSVSDLAAASIGAAALAIGDLLFAADGQRRDIVVDRRLSSFWFASSLRPSGWSIPPPWNLVAADYRAKDGWIRLHTNAPRHLEAALNVLGVEEDKEKVAASVSAWDAESLESEIVNAGGCAATMRRPDEWIATEAGRSVAAEPLISWQETGDAPPLSPRLETGKPLNGLRVLDLTRVLAGPVATRFLAQLGANVLRIDPPDWDEPGVLPEIMLGKRTARMDLRQAEQIRSFASLLSECDILVHGYRPGALDDLGLGEGERRRIRPGLIEVTLDAYGWSGPWKRRRGFDSLVQMSCGIAEAGMRLLGRDRPTPLPVQALDHATGYLMAFAAVSAIAHRLKTGRSVRARLSLARTAGLLARYPCAFDEGGFAEEDEGDLSGESEQTGWGPARRLKPPMAIEGVSLLSARPAMPLGAHEAAW